MAATLTITAKGQVTLRKEILAHLGAKPGDRLVVDLLDVGERHLGQGDPGRCSGLENPSCRARVLECKVTECEGARGVVKAVSRGGQRYVVGNSDRGRHRTEPRLRAGGATADGLQHGGRIFYSYVGRWPTRPVAPAGDDSGGWRSKPGRSVRAQAASVRTRRWC